MDCYTDWSCRLLRCDTSGSTPPEAIRAMEYLSNQFHISRFCVMPEYDATRRSVPMFLLQLERSANLLRAYLPQHLQLKIVPRVYLTPGLWRTEGLHRLLFTRHRYLPLQLPFCEYADWIDEELNHLLFTCRVVPLFTTSELFRKLYPADVADKLFRIRGAVFQFNYRALTDDDARRDVSLLLLRGQTVLPGTGLTSLAEAWQYDFDHYQKTATKKLSVADYHRLMHQSRVFWDLPRR